MTADLDLQDLGEVHRRVVTPVLDGLFRPGELISIELVAGAPEGHPHAGDHDALWLKLVDHDADTHWERIGKALDHLVSAADLAWYLEDRITEWLSETRYAWSEERHLMGPFPGPTATIRDHK